MIKSILASAAIALSLLGAGQASGATITLQTFDAQPSLSSTQGAGLWYTDRYAPAGFQSVMFQGDNRLMLSLSSSDGGLARPSNFGSGFYNTQGRKYDIGGATDLSVDFYLDPLFQSATGRIAGLWGTALGGTNAISAYPILEFANGAFQFWDGAMFQNAAASFTYGTFVNLRIELDTNADLFRFSVGGSSVGTIGANGSVQIGNGMLQGYNTANGVDRDIYFDNFMASNVAPVPVPAALPLMMIALAGLGLVGRRRRNG